MSDEDEQQPPSKPYADMPPPRRKVPDDKVSRLLAVVRRRVERAIPGPWRYEHGTNSIYGGEAVPGDSAYAIIEPHSKECAQ